MKKMLLCVLVQMSFLSLNSFAGERVILQDSKVINLEVSNKTVRCSSLGYGMAELKINIADLDGWTIFDHTNVNFGDRNDLPCMTAGACKPGWDENEAGFEINDVIQNNPRIEKIIVHRSLFEVRNMSEVNGRKVCHRTLKEVLTTVIGGVPFTHMRRGLTETFPQEACHF